jgi:5-methylcytosine-specific restriction endonuclease McrA
MTLRKGKGLKATTGLSNKGNLSNKGSKLNSKKVSINKKSDRQIKIETDLQEVYSKMDQQSDGTCKGCGRPDKFLTHSHIIPRSRRRDLVAVGENITFHCVECHDTWEHGPDLIRQQMNDYTKNMEYIKSVDKEYYNLLVINK